MGDKCTVDCPVLLMRFMGGSEYSARSKLHRLPEQLGCGKVRMSCHSSGNVNTSIIAHLVQDDVRRTQSLNSLF